MKNLFFVFGFTMLCVFGFSQSSVGGATADSVAKMTPKQMDSARNAAMKNFGNGGKNATETKTVSVSDELLFIRKNLGAYQRAHDSGMILQLVGVAVGVGGYLATNKTSPNVSKIMPFVGGGLCLLGWGVYLSAGRFMHRIELGVSGGGANVKYTF